MTLIFLKDPQKKKFTSELEKKNPNTIFTKILCVVFQSLRHKKRENVDKNKPHFWKLVPIFIMLENDP